jgi:hypothetical protein
MDFTLPPFQITDVTVGEQFHRNGVKIGWTVLAINDEKITYENRARMKILLTVWDIQCKILFGVPINKFNEAMNLYEVGQVVEFKSEENKNELAKGLVIEIENENIHILMDGKVDPIVVTVSDVKPLSKPEQKPRDIYNDRFEFSDNVLNPNFEYPEEVLLNKPLAIQEIDVLNPNFEFPFKVLFNKPLVNPEKEAVKQEEINLEVPVVKEDILAQSPDRIKVGGRSGFNNRINGIYYKNNESH